MDTLRLADANRADLQRRQVKNLMRALSARAFGGPDPGDYFVKAWPSAIHRDLVVRAFDPVLRQKAAIAPGTTTDATWAAPLMPQELLHGFMAMVNAVSVLGKLPLTPAPFNTKIAKQTAGSSTAWVGENTPKPTSTLAFGNVSLLWSKAVSYIVVTNELLRLAAPGSAEQLAATLRNEMVVFTDKEFLGTAAAVANVRPAGILNGLTPVTATADLAADLRTLVNTFYTNRPYPFAPYMVISPATASKIAVLDMGRAVTATGGTLLGLPIVTTPAAGAHAIVLDAPGIYLADGGIDLDTSKEALLQMNDAPDSPPTAATVFISLFQTNATAIRCERFVNWVKVASNSVQYVVVA